MIVWNAIAIGLFVGAVISGAFFCGLGWGIHFALGRAHSGLILLASAAFRIALLLLCGWAVAGLGVWSLVGFVIAFFVMRFVIVRWVRLPIEQEGQ